jgi:hypothetical protein
VVTAPRRPCGNSRRKLEDILVIGLAVLVCNGFDFEGMKAFGAYREAELRKVLELPNGIPDESTFFGSSNGYGRNNWGDACTNGGRGRGKRKDGP